MAEPTDTPASHQPRRAPDVLTLVAGLITLAVAGMALVGWTPNVSLPDLRWLLAAAAVLIGLLLLAASTRPTRRR